MNSIEKLAKFQADLTQSEPDDEQSAQLMQLAQMVGPFLGPMLPEDPAELDGYLLKLSAWMLGQRSDDVTPAARVAVLEVDGEVQKWRVLDKLEPEPEPPAEAG
jgi:hypothetical protein